MYDIYCSHCGEPHDHDLLHDLGGFTYDAAAILFKTLGCALIDQRDSGQFIESRVCLSKPVGGQYSLDAIKAAHDLSDYPDEWDYYTADLIDRALARAEVDENKLAQILA